MKVFIVFGMLLFLLSCQEGVSPDDGQKESFLSGKIIIVSGKESWPPPDSSKELRIIVVPQYPPYNIFADILEGRAYLSDTLPRFVDTITYSTKIQRTPMPEAYILASLRFGTISQQRMIGFYKSNQESKVPDKLYIGKGIHLKNLNIFVDFKNLPEQKPVEK